MANKLQELAHIIAQGREPGGGPNIQAIKGLFGIGGCFAQRSVTGLDHERPPFVRNAYGKGETEHVAYAGLINPDNPPSGQYGGFSLVWFPSEEGCVIAFGIGTRGLNPDEGILARPGHRRRVEGLRRYLVEQGAMVWARQDPTALGVHAPSNVVQKLKTWDTALKRYAGELYCLAAVTKDKMPLAEKTVRAFIDLYAYERRWEPLKEYKLEHDEFIAGLNAYWLVSPSVDDVVNLLRARRFVVLEGPPGTGKSRMAKEILDGHFAKRGFVTQFHPSTTYESFVAGLAPDIGDQNLKFTAKAGSLMEAAKKAKEGEALLIIDEINRADLGRVLGEAIYLFEVERSDAERAVQLPYAVDNSNTFSLPKNLFILATMNTADRSIARIDLAIRRRFAFVSIMPSREVVKKESIPAALMLFDSLSDVFLEFAPEQALSLLPGHSYFLAQNEAELRRRLLYELIPLLDDYIREGYLGPATPALHSVRNQFADEARKQG